MAVKISEQERRNVWLSLYSATLAGQTQGVEDLDDEEVQEDLRKIAVDLAEGGLADYEAYFTGSENEEEEPTRKRRRAS